MHDMSVTEKVCASLPTAIVTSLIAASGAVFLAPLLPVLTNSIASNRAEKRITKALKELDFRLSKYEEKIKNLSDNQYKLIGDLVSAIMQSTSDSKILLLQDATVGCIFMDEVEEHEASILARVLRDITVVEFKCLLFCKDYNEIVIRSVPVKGVVSRPNMLDLRSEEPQAHILNNLVYLNLLRNEISGYGVDIYIKYTPIADKLIKLCSL
jgi:hypothetical protein